MGHSITIAVIICVAFASVVPASATFRPDEAQSPTEKTLTGGSHCYRNVSYRDVSFPAFGQEATNLRIDGAVAGYLDSEGDSNDASLTIQIARFDAEKVCLESNSSDGTKGIRLTFHQAEFENATVRGPNVLAEHATADSISFHVSEQVGSRLLSQFEKSKTGDGSQNETTGGDVTDPAERLPDDIKDGDAGSQVPNQTDEVDNRTDGPRDSVDNTTDDVKDGAENTTDDVRDGVDNTTDDAKDSVDNTTDTVDDTTDDVKDGVENTTDDTKDMVEDTTKTVSDSVDDTTDTVENTTDDTKDTVDDTADDTKDTVDNTTDDTTTDVEDTTKTVSDSVDDTKDTVDSTTDDTTTTTTTSVDTSVASTDTTTTSTTTTDDTTDGVTELTNQTTTTETTSTDTSTEDGSTDGTTTTDDGGVSLSRQFSASALA
ncbi:hypothetical protein [Haladaptatus sp. NG-SE-30]